VKALKVNGSCTDMKWSFSGFWSGDGQKNLFVSCFFDRAAEVMEHLILAVCSI
jgi:hypothetical protein